MPALFPRFSLVLSCKNVSITPVFTEDAVDSSQPPALTLFFGVAQTKHPVLVPSNLLPCKFDPKKESVLGSAFNVHTAAILTFFLYSFLNRNSLVTRHEKVSGLSKERQVSLLFKQRQNQNKTQPNIRAFREKDDGRVHRGRLDW